VTSDRLPFVSAAALRELLRPRTAVESIETALRAGLDPADDPARMAVTMANGQLLVMPAQGADHAGVKIVSVAPGNPALGRPRIQGVYLLLDAATLAPLALLDGTALTTLRTPAVSLAAVRPVLLGGRGRDASPLRVTVFGAGPQAIGHVETLFDVASPARAVASVTYVVRRPEHAAVPTLPAVPVKVIASTSAETRGAVAEADLIVCATTAREPLFDGATVRDDAVIVAVGSHEPEAREVDAALVARAHVVVEDVRTATREAGDVVQAISGGGLRVEDLIPVSDVVTGRTSPALDRPLLFKSTGMAWEDLVVATAAYSRWSAGQAVDVRTVRDV
jgi:ornithine cyclodeaminase/alanine dehydrogenase-like protein (mu-crystallin family)